MENAGISEVHEEKLPVSRSHSLWQKPEPITRPFTKCW